MKAIILAVTGSLALGTAAFAAGSGPGSANNAPAQEMQQTGSQNPSQYGTTDTTGHGPGHEMGATTGSTGRAGTANEAGAAGTKPAPANR